jgi:hypothetical protein
MTLHNVHSTQYWFEDGNSNTIEKWAFPGLAMPAPQIGPDSQVSLARDVSPNYGFEVVSVLSKIEVHNLIHVITVRQI